MFNPLPLRLCCLAAMAPALTSEAATRAREKLPGVPTPPHPSTPAVLHGRGCTSPSLTTSDLQQTRQIITPKITLPTLPKEFIQKKLIDTTLSTVGGKTSLLGLGTVSSRADLLQDPQEPGTLDQTPLLEPGRGDESSQCSSPEKGMSQAHTAATTSHASTGTQQNMPQTDPATAMPPLNVNNQTSSSATTTDSSGILADQMPHTSMQKSSDCNMVLSTTSLAGLPKIDSLTNGVNPLTHKPAISTVAELPPSPFPLQAKMAKMEVSKGLNNRHPSHDSAPTEVIVAETVKRQADLDTRAERLLRRLRRLQSRQGASHVRKQLTGFVDIQQKNLNAIVKASKTTGGNGGSVDIKAELFGNREVKNLSTAALVNLVHKLQSSQPVTLRQHLATTPQDGGGDADSRLKFEEETCIEIDRVSGHLHSSLSQLESDLDSDATESSSGGESCDELDFDEDWGDSKMSRPSIHRRAEWKWAMDRAAVASRWTWLQAQVSDLEYRIRQQYDIYRQIRMSKGAVVLGEAQLPEDLLSKARNNQRTTSNKKLSPLEEKIASIERKNEVSPSTVSGLLSNVDKQSSSLTRQLGSVYSPLTPKGGGPNGVVDPGAMSNCTSTPESSVASDIDSVEHVNKKQRTELEAPSPGTDSSCQAARCRPVRTYRKRKLLKTSGLHQMSRKAARLSTVKCGCYPPAVPCAMCGGRINNTVTLEPDVMPLQERVSLLDPSFHPVLSFRQDIPLATHFESLLKSGEWQQKSPPKPTKAAGGERKRKNVKERVRKYKQRMPRNATAALLSSAKIRSKYDTKPRTPNPLAPTTPKTPNSNSIRRKNRLISASSRQQRLAGQDTPFGKGSGESPLSHSASSSSLKDMKEAINKKRRGESAFDINNIVIPYSIASATRVEKLQYKEIITPKWREIVNGDGKTRVKAEVKEESGPATPLTPGLAAPSGTPISTPGLPAPSGTPLSTPGLPAPVSTPGTPATPVITPGVTGRTTPGPSHNGPSSIPGVTIVPTEHFIKGEPPEPTDEDLSDEAYAARHTRSEALEKKRFISYNTLGQRRGRANRAESGCATPEPFSPAEHAVPPRDIPGREGEPAVTPPSTPVPPPEDGEERARAGSGDRGERRRNSSASSRTDRRRSVSHSEDRGERTRHDTLTEPEEEEIPPWLERRFPLSDSDYESLFHEKPKAVVTEVNEVGKGVGPLPISDPPSPAPSSGSEALEDDPNDPEWTVIAERTPQQKITGSGLVLKLARR